jgi:hypothetical protein
VRRISYELAARLVQLSEALAHALEAPRELSNLILPLVLDRLLERAGGNPIGATLEAPDTRGELAGAQ